MDTLQICPPHLSDVATLPVEIQKKWFFSTLIFIYFRLFTLSQKKTNSNCCAAALAVYLLLFNASYYLHSPSTGGACVLIRTCWGLWQRLVVTCAEFQHSVVYYATDQCRKKDWKHVLTQKVVTLNTCCDIACLTFQLPHITVGSFQSHRRQPTTGFFQSLCRLKDATYTFSQMKKFCSSEVSVVTFSGRVGKWFTVCFLLR